MASPTTEKTDDLTVRTPETAVSATEPARQPAATHHPVTALTALLLWLTVSSVLPAKAAVAQVEPADEIRFRVTGLRSDEGYVVCSLFPEDGWLKQPALAVKAAITSGFASCLLANPAVGNWGIAAFHDEDDDGELDANFLHIPKEGTCASNNAFRRMGPPRYRDARFEYPGGLLELEAEMRYLSKR